MSCVTFNKSEVFILLKVHTLGSQSSNSIGKKQNPGSIRHRQSRREPIKPPGKREQTFAVILNVPSELSLTLGSFAAPYRKAPQLSGS